MRRTQNLTRGLILSVAAMLAAGTAAAQSRVPAPTPEQTEFVGWARFSNGEFQLYSARIDVQRPLATRPCVSGAASRGVMRQAAGDLGGQKVRISGRTTPWTEASNNRVEVGGSTIRNDCAGAFVIVADDIRPAN